jgi:sensor histidine kinase YesM
MQFSAAKAGVPLSPGTFGWIMAIPMLFSLLLMPLYAGYLQLVDAAERELPASASDIFKPYRQGEALRLIGYAVAVILLYVAISGLIIVATGGGLASWYMQAMIAQPNQQLPPPTLPPGFGISMILFMLFFLFLSGFYAISLGQVALNRRNAFGAIGDGVIGALKNMLPLLVFAVSALLGWIGVAIVLILLVGLLALIGKLVGTWLVVVLLIPVYIALVLVMFSAMFGVMYYLWRDVCSDDIVPDVAEAIAA